MSATPRPVHATQPLVVQFHPYSFEITDGTDSDPDQIVVWRWCTVFFDEYGVRVRKIAVNFVAATDTIAEARRAIPPGYESLGPGMDDRAELLEVWMRRRSDV